MQIDNLGGGIVLFKDALEVDEEFVQEYMRYLKQKNEQHFFAKDDVITNTAGYEFDKESADVSPGRFTETVIEDTPQHFVDFSQACEDALYKCIVEYCKIFPVVAEAITWRIKGHIATYSNGQNIGCHSDSAIPLDKDYKPINQMPLHNTVTAGLSWTSNYEGGDLHYRMWDVSVRLEAGDVIMYPSTYLGAHEVSPVTGGERIVYLQWFCHGDTGQLQRPEDTPNTVRSPHTWLLDLKNDVGQQNLYQNKVY
jgi:predicted 2-oxoglutarate/Fe(II)-dependent dioxygenase YbiX